MAIYYCPKCNKKYFLDCEINDTIENSFKCEFCGYSKATTKTSDDVSTETNNMNNNEASKYKKYDEILLYYIYNWNCSIHIRLFSAIVKGFNII